MKSPIAIAYYPEGDGPAPGPVQRWQARNPLWRESLATRVVCPICGIPIRVVADLALLDERALEAELRRFRDGHLRSACPEHHRPTLDEWAYIESARQ